MKKRFLLLLPVLLLSASCSLFSESGGAGLVKTVNGGVDWTVANKQNGGSGSMTAANISKLSFDPNNTEIVYAGSYNGGLFISEDSGEVWKNILAKISVYDFFVHPSNPKVIYAAGDFGTSGKVLKTEDGGKSWLQKYSEANASTPVRSIAFNPKDPQQIVIGTETGNVIRSIDGGNNWQLLKNFSTRISKVYWENSGVYALVREKGLYKGSGNSDDFVELTGALLGDSLFDQFNNRVSARWFNQAYIDSFSGNLMYVTTDIGLYKSTDSGKSWQAVKLPVKQENLNVRPITVSRQSSNIVLTGVGPTVYKSTDGGNSFQTQSLPFSGAFVNYILLDPKLPQIMYAGGYLPENN